MNLIIILLSVGLNAFAQIMLKLGASALGGLKVQTAADIFPIVFNKYVIGGLLCYACSIVLWFYVLSKVPVSYAYPFLSLGFIIVLLLSYFLLSETINIYKIIGIVCIVIGVIFIYRFGK